MGRLLCCIKELALYLFYRLTNYSLKGQSQLLACIAHELRMVFKFLMGRLLTKTVRGL